MTPDDIELVQQTVDQISRMGDQVVAEFYRRLFDRVPEARAMFGDEMDVQRQKFLDTLTQIVAALTDLASLTASARDLGSRHRTYGVQARHYDEVREVLIETMAATLGDRFTDRHAAAWRQGWALISEIMQQGTEVDRRAPRLSDRRA